MAGLSLKGWIRRSQCDFNRWFVLKGNVVVHVYFYSTGPAYPALRQGYITTIEIGDGLERRRHSGRSTTLSRSFRSMRGEMARVASEAFAGVS